MDVKKYLDSTYLKTPEQAGLTVEENTEVVRLAVAEAIHEDFKLIMIRPEMVVLAREMVVAANSRLLVGTVIDFPEGRSNLKAKIIEAQAAIENGADDLDFVCNYTAFKNGEVELVKEEILEGTRLGLANFKTVKWIIEVAALTEKEIIQLSALIKNVVMLHFEENQYASVFVKSSTGFYKTKDGKPNGATLPTITMMIENASPLSIKAAGGVRTFEEAMQMISLGVKRIGTSGAKAIAGKQSSINEY
ncbi:deoxyribose-phosphate aldolase [Flavobacterium sp. TAB 87]|uniref:deoxyribose-phosphate aldolase n=1 Tax=Flavobacterium sp. TAB 87 TaxID=1729581 RepID=UPI00076C4E15|nr:deoxyribose-phosphate aldolase [Flavobacterium sp. TAB 87]KVV14505.1 Deoxyribose-phosphate aldolase 1 [Flavobacterium sp. TAB 87]